MTAVARRHEQRLQAGVVPWRSDRHGQTEILLVTTRAGRSRRRGRSGSSEVAAERWTIPKGNVPTHLSPRLAAAREAFEEAGLLGPIGPEVGAYLYRKRGVEHRVTLFALRPLVELPIWPEGHLRRRIWLPLEESIEVVERPSLQQALMALRQVAAA